MDLSSIGISIVYVLMYYRISNHSMGGWPFNISPYRPP